MWSAEPRADQVDPEEATAPELTEPSADLIAAASAENAAVVSAVDFPVDVPLPDTRAVSEENPTDGVADSAGEGAEAVETLGGDELEEA